jgi:lipid II:glycine glycyltransferase (peptidoglycan interpeptide bridge formation enzyme)
MVETKRYTYIVDISDIDSVWNKFEKETRYEIKKCEQIVRVSDDIYKFDYFHSLSRPDRKIDFDFIKNTYSVRQPNCRMYATDTAMAMVSWDKERGYYLLAGRDKLMKPDGSPSKILWRIMNDLNKMGIKEFDLCGANTPSVTHFKKNFGGKLCDQKEPCLKY